MPLRLCEVIRAATESGTESFVSTTTERTRMPTDAMAVKTLTVRTTH